MFGHERRIRECGNRWNVRSMITDRLVGLTNSAVRAADEYAQSDTGGLIVFEPSTRARAAMNLAYTAMWEELKTAREYRKLVED